ncbi:S41 family peptidase [Henriciella sp. AS95]|uniref:S41 family peptidase n=1 Tax=Henriciella sp. AS95 TaxID=3135782 RepID=UPI003170D5C9
MSVLLAAALAALCPVEADVMDEAARAFEAHYVLQDRAPSIALAIREDAAVLPRSDACQAPERFADEATAYLRDVSNDRHVKLDATRASPEDAEADEGGSWIEDWYAAAPSKNHGVAAVEILDGNIGYLKLTSFYDLPETWARYGAAFTLLQDTEALILDLRGNGGGSPEAELRVQWSMLEPGTTPPIVMDRGADGLEQRPVPEIDWPRYGARRPLYILTSGRTFSAAEAVTYGLQAAGRARVVGEATGGGAHMVGDGLALSDSFSLYMPEERPISPHTGGNWEGAGVPPDLVVDASDALDAALDDLTILLAAETAD